MMPIEFPDGDAFRTATDVTVDAYPPVAPVRRERTLDPVNDLSAATRAAVDRLPLDQLEPGARIGITAGSRGIRDFPPVLSSAVDALADRGFKPFIIAAMGSHGGATASGQRETLAALGITESAMGCEIRANMEVEPVDTDAKGRPVYVAADALAADGIVLANRIKPHTDFTGPVESGLCKMAVIGLGKHRGAASLHKAGLADAFAEVIMDRARRIIEAAPILGGIGLVDDATERATCVEGIPADRILDREPELLERAYQELPMLPVDDLDLLIVDEIGKDISGTAMDTNVIGRSRFYGESEPDTPSISRIYARSLTPASHGNAVGIGLADVVHREVIEAIDLADTYINVATSGEPERGKLPVVMPDDRTALELIPSTVGVESLESFRFARIRNTLDPDELVVSAPVARELVDREDLTVGTQSPLELSGAQLTPFDAPADR